MKIHSTRGFDDVSLHYIQQVAANRQEVPPQNRQYELTVERGYSGLKTQAKELSILARISRWIYRALFKSPSRLHRGAASGRVSEFGAEVYGVTYNSHRKPSPRETHRPQ
jgi:hypothetical protein